MTDERIEEQSVVDNVSTTEPEQAESQPQTASESWQAARDLIGKQGETIKELTAKQYQYEQRLQNLTPAVPKEEEFDINSLPDDYIVEAKDVKRMRKKEEKRYAALERRQVKHEMRDKYEDFKSVCSDANIDKLEQSDPYLAQAIHNTPDPYTRWELAYNGIKRNGIYKTQDKSQNDEIAGYNASRPKPVAQIKSSQSRSALGQAGAWSGVLTPEQKAAYYQSALKVTRGE